jgi:hypothetical protein
MTAARHLPSTRLHRGARTQPHTAPFPAAPLSGERAGNRPHQGPGLAGHGPYFAVPGHGPDTGKKGAKPALTPARSFRDDLGCVRLTETERLSVSQLSWHNSSDSMVSPGRGGGSGMLYFRRSSTVTVS